jgi:hypothetical protein
MELHDHGSKRANGILFAHGLDETLASAAVARVHSELEESNPLRGVSREASEPTATQTLGRDASSHDESDGDADSEPDPEKHGLLSDERSDVLGGDGHEPALGR